MAIDADPKGSDSLQHLIRHLPGPLAGGAREDTLPLDEAGRSTLSAGRREPALFVVLARDLRRETLRLEAVLDPDGDATALTPVVFAPYSEHGAMLPLFVPTVDPETQRAGAVTVALGAQLDVAAVTVDELGQRIAVRVVEGLFGRLLYLINAEVPRLRRQARELGAMRRLDGAESGALDALGAELAVPRFAEALDFRATGEITSRTEREGDVAYRRRLALFRQNIFPSPTMVAHWLNGSDEAPGPLQAMGANGRFRLVEADNPLRIAVKLVSIGQDQSQAETRRDHFLDYLRGTTLIDPTDDMPAERFVSSREREAENALRLRLRDSVTFAGTDQAMAPILARALDRLARLLQAVGESDRLTVHRAQDDAGGSRFELGLGLELEALDAAARTAIGDAIESVDPADIDDRPAADLLRLLTRPETDDPDMRWLFEACGFRTVHRMAADRLYLSHFSTGGLALEAPSAVAFADAAGGIPLAGRLFPALDRETTAVLADAIDAEGGEALPYSLLTNEEAPSVWEEADRPDDTVATLLRARGLPVLENPERLLPGLAPMPPELLATLRFEDAFVDRIRNGEDDAFDDLAALVQRFADLGVAAALPVTTSSGFVLISSAVALPQVGTNLGGRRSTGVRWYAIPLTGSPVHLRAVGSRTQLRPRGTGLVAVVALAYARSGNADPYEFRIEAEARDLRLDHLQYEYLMNLLGRLHPAGVEVNTWPIRQHHVVLAEAAGQAPLGPSASRTFRPYHRPRHAGIEAVTLSSVSAS